MTMFIIQELVRTAVLAFVLYNSTRLVVRLVTIHALIITPNSTTRRIHGADKNGNFSISKRLIFTVAIGWAVVFIWQHYTPFGSY